MWFYQVLTFKKKNIFVIFRWFYIKNIPYSMQQNSILLHNLIDNDFYFLLFCYMSADVKNTVRLEDFVIHVCLCT